MTISRCPGDFSDLVPEPCRKMNQFRPTFNITSDGANVYDVIETCNIGTGEKMYVNVRAPQGSSQDIGYLLGIVIREYLDEPVTSSSGE
jgi:hypothetical protein